MDYKQLLKTSGIEAGDCKDILTPFKPRPGFSSGHFAFVVMLTFIFFIFPGTVYTATTTTLSQSSQPATKPGNQLTSQVRESSKKKPDESQEKIENQLKNQKETTNQIEQKTDWDKLRDWLTLIFSGLTPIVVAFVAAYLNRKTQTEITKLKDELTHKTQTEITKLKDELTRNTQTEITKLESELTGDMLRDARLEEHVFNSLQWLSGKTQRRSIGIAVIDANWKNEKLSHLRETWTSVLVAQAVYLLAEQEREEAKQRQHEITNANNILRILEKTVIETELLDYQHVKELERALAARAEEEKATKGNSKHGLDLPPEVLDDWQKLVKNAKSKLKK